MPSPLRSPLQRRIIAAYTVNRLGTWIGTVALSLAVFDHTHSALAVAAVLIAAQVLPAFAVPAVIARVEASRRGRELSGLYLIEAAATTAIALLLSSFWLPGVLVLVAVDGTAALAANALLRTAAARAARSEAGAGDDPKEAEQRVNAAINVAFSGTFVGGPVLAGLLVAGPGAAVALLIDAGTFVACGALLLDLHPRVEEAAGDAVAARLRAAWRYMRRAPALRALILAQGVGLVFFESAVPIEVPLAKRTLHIGDSGYGLLVTVWGVGVVLGSIVFARWGSRRLGAMLSLGTLAIGAGYLGFSAAPSLAPAIVASFVGGVGNGMQYAPVISSLQRLTPSDLQGRMMGALESVSAISPAIGLALGGALTAAASPRIAFVIVGSGAALVAALFYRIHVDRVPSADEGESGAAAIAASGAPIAAEIPVTPGPAVGTRVEP